MPSIRLQDILDILIMSFLIYQLYSWFRRSRAIQVLAGLGVVIAFFFLTRQTGLQMTSWVLQQLETVLIVLVVVVFQNEIRQALYRFSLLRGLVGNSPPNRCSSPDTLSEAVFELAAEQTGAIIVLQRQDRLDEHLLHGVPLDAQISAPLLRNLFHDGSPLHDGAVLIRDERIAHGRLSVATLRHHQTCPNSTGHGTGQPSDCPNEPMPWCWWFRKNGEKFHWPWTTSCSRSAMPRHLKNRLEDLLVPQADATPHPARQTAVQRSAAQGHDPAGGLGHLAAPSYPARRSGDRPRHPYLPQPA